MKKIPTFASKKEEQAFWTTADSTEYIDWKKSKKVILPMSKLALTTYRKQPKS